MSTAAGALVSVPSLTVNEKVSLPDQPGLGVYRRSGATPESAPWAGGVTIAKATASPSGSLPASTRGTGVSCGVMALPPCATGARLSCQRTAWVIALAESESPATCPTLLIATAALTVPPDSGGSPCIPPAASHTKAWTSPLAVIDWPTT